MIGYAITDDLDHPTVASTSYEVGSASIRALRYLCSSVLSVVEKLSFVFIRVHAWFARSSKIVIFRNIKKC